MTGEQLEQLQDALAQLASRARRLPPPSARKPEAFHEERSELAGDLQRLSAWLKLSIRAHRIPLPELRSLRR